MEYKCLLSSFLRVQIYEGPLVLLLDFAECQISVKDSPEVGDGSLSTEVSNLSVCLVVHHKNCKCLTGLVDGSDVKGSVASIRLTVENLGPLGCHESMLHQECDQRSIVMLGCPVQSCVAGVRI